MTPPVVPATGRILAVDLGDVRVGIAVSDAGQIVASPRTTVEVAGVLGRPLSRDGRAAEHGETSDDDLEAIADAVLELEDVGEVVGIVVGYPRRLSGREGAAARRARRLASILERRGGRPVVLWDERLSSVEAERVMLAQDAGRRERRESVDRVAAAVILQGYLESRRLGRMRPGDVEER